MYIMKIRNTIEKILVGIIVWFFLFIFILYQYASYEDQKHMEELRKNLYIIETYKDIWKYRIWKKTSWPVFWWDVWTRNTICNLNTRECLNWELKGIFIEWEKIYVYLFNDIVYSLEYSSLERWIDYPILYSLWENEYIETPESFEDIKQFWIFTQESMNFYSLNDLSQLPENEQDILLNLKDNPRFLYE